MVLLSGLFDALAAVVELCTPNKLVAREVGAVDVASTLLLMVAEVRAMGVASEWAKKVRVCFGRDSLAGHTHT